MLRIPMVLIFAAAVAAGAAPLAGSDFTLFVSVGEDRSADIDSLEKTVAAEPGNAKALNDRGALLGLAGRIEEACLDFDRAAAADPQMPVAIYNRGLVKARQGNYESALENFTRALTLKGDFAEAYVNRGNAYLKLGRHPQALADYDRARELNAGSEMAANNRGEALFNMGRIEEARASFDAAIRLNPNYSFAHTNRGHCRELTGDYADALADFNRALELDPEDGEAYKARAWFFATCPDKALRDGNRAVADALKGVGARKDTQSLDVLAAAYAESGRFPEAAEKAAEAAGRAPTAELRARLDGLATVYRAGKTYADWEGAKGGKTGK